MLKKLFIVIGLGIVFSSGFSYTPVAAQTPTDYKLLAPIPYIGKTNNEIPETTATSVSYITGAVKLIIALAGAFAVMKLVLAGFQYMTTEAFTGKSRAKESLQNTFFGFLLVISSYVILNTVNPKLLDFDLNIEGVTTINHGDVTLTVPDDRGFNGTEDTVTASVNRGPSFGHPWSINKTTRDMLAALKINVNHPECANIGDTACTSLYNMSPKVIDGIKSFKTSCKIPDNNLIITGGTEYWLHGNRSTELTGPTANTTGHQPGGNAVDLSRTDSVNACITNNGTREDSIKGCSTGDKYIMPGGAVFVDEKISGNAGHWHVCFY